jgi:hypothetical protein
MKFHNNKKHTFVVVVRVQEEEVIVPLDYFTGHCSSSAVKCGAVELWSQRQRLAVHRKDNI